MLRLWGGGPQRWGLALKQLPSLWPRSAPQGEVWAGPSLPATLHFLLGGEEGGSRGRSAD